MSCNSWKSRGIISRGNCRKMESALRVWSSSSTKICSYPFNHLLLRRFLFPYKPTPFLLFYGCAPPPSSLLLYFFSSSSSTSSSPPPPPAGARSPRRPPQKTMAPSTSDRDSIRSLRLKKVGELREKGLEPYAYKWDRTHSAHQLQEIHKHLANGIEDDTCFVSVAGRIVARRAFGKPAFLTLRDDSGTIQLYCEKERLADAQFDHLKSLVDIGDILGANGSINLTDKGELSVCVNSFSILTKSLLPLPDKFHGLTDVDKSYRQRYVDMIANPEVADTFRNRAKVVSEVCKTVESLGFVEVETPVLQICYFD